MNPIDQQGQPVYHIARQEWLATPTGRPHGDIQLKTLNERVFRTGTARDLSCRFSHSRHARARYVKIPPSLFLPGLESGML